jgi:hypothetical protein
MRINGVVRARKVPEMATFVNILLILDPVTLDGGKSDVDYESSTCIRRTYFFKWGYAVAKLVAALR